MFTEGRQPCANYNGQKTGNEYGSWVNVHECFGPYDGRPRGCSGTVSFCDACSTDHHSGGWDTCGRTTKEQP